MPRVDLAVGDRVAVLGKVSMSPGKLAVKAILSKRAAGFVMDLAPGLLATKTRLRKHEPVMGSTTLDDNAGARTGEGP